MQDHGGVPAEKAILSNERQFMIRLMVDWNLNGSYDHPMSNMTQYVNTAVTDRGLQGNQSEDLRIVQGSSAAELRVDLAGEYEGLSLTGVFSPYQVRSPFWGKDTIGMEVTYEIGLYTSIGLIWYPQFIGIVRAITPDRGAGSVTLEALDRVELLRRPVEFPAWGMFGPQRVQQNRITSQLADPQWVIDHCLRESDVSPTPWRPTLREEMGLADDDPTGTQLWISGTGGFTPNIGWLDNWNQHSFPDTEGGGPQMYEIEGEPHPGVGVAPLPKNLRGLGVTGGSIHKYWGADRNRINDVATQVAGFTMITRGSNATFYQTAANHKVLDIRLGGGLFMSLWVGDSGKFWTEWTNGIVTLTSTKVTIPTGGSSQRCVAMWDVFRPGGARVWVRAGSNVSGVDWTNLATTPAYPGTTDYFKGQVTLDHRTALNDIFYVSSNFGSLSVAGAEFMAGRPATYAAELDSGLNRLSFFPTRRAEDAWNVISDIASAEFGAVFWSEDGIFKFWSQEALDIRKQIVTKTVTLDEVTGLRITNHLDSIRNIWSLVNATKMTFDLVAIDAQNPDEYYVPGNSARVYVYNLDDVIAPNPALVPRYSTTGTYPAWDENVIYGYVVQWFNGSVWAEDNGKSSGVDINAYLNHKGEIEIRIFNGYSEPCRLANDDNQGALRINSTRIVEDEPSTATFKNLGSIAKFGGRNIALDGDWHQEFSNLTGMVSRMLNKTIVPNPVTDDITMAGDPRIQLADTVRINDVDGFGERFDVQIYGITRTWSLDGGLSDTYTVELVRPAGSTWDDPVYGIWDQTFMWGV